jgi:hypothetical protein
MAPSRTSRFASGQGGQPLSFVGPPPVRQMRLAGGQTRPRRANNEEGPWPRDPWQSGKLAFNEGVSLIGRGYLANWQTTRPAPASLTGWTPGSAWPCWCLPMHKAALTVKSIPEVPAIIQQLFSTSPYSAKCNGGRTVANGGQVHRPPLQKRGKLANSIFFATQVVAPFSTHTW